MPWVNPERSNSSPEWATDVFAMQIERQPGDLVTPLPDVTSRALLPVNSETLSIPSL